MLRCPSCFSFALLLALMGSGCTDETPARPAAPTRALPADSAEQVDLDAPGLDGDEGVGQTVYVPAYSHIYSQDIDREIDLAATLSIRNTDPEHSITVGTILYHESDGRLVRTYPGATLAPLASFATVVDETDRTGGVGANFIVRWQADARVSPPIVEAVMISTANAQGISFVTTGRVIRPITEAD